MQQRKLHIFDASLGHDKGHFENFNRETLKFLTENNYDVDVYSHRDSKYHIHKEEKCHDVFSIALSQINHILKKNDGSDEAAMNEISSIVYDDLKKLDKSRFKSDDVIIYHSSHIYFLNGILKWLDEFEHPPFFVGHIYCSFYDPKNIHQILEQKSYQLFKNIFEQFSDKLKEKVYFFHESALTVQVLQEVLNYKNCFKIHPICYVPKEIGYRQINDSNTVKIGYFYRANYANLHIRDIAKEVFSHFTGLAHFSFHVPPFVDGRDEYYNTLKEYDLVILPYNRADYSYKNSGVFNECTGLGTTVLMPNDTVLEKENDELGLNQLIYETDEAAAISKKIFHFYKNRMTYQRQTLEIAQRFRQEYGVNCYINRILQAVSA